MTKLSTIFRTAISGYMFFNRSPNRLIPEGQNIVTPADGIIVDIDNNKIEIFIGILDIHVQRAPQSGIVTNIIGKNKEYNLIELNTDMGYVIIERWAGNLAKTVTTDVNIGDYINKGSVIGRILLGSHAAITIPPGLTIKVTKGQHVTAGETIIAE